MIGRNELKIKWYPDSFKLYKQGNMWYSTIHNNSWKTIHLSFTNMKVIYIQWGFFPFFSAQPRWLCSEFSSPSMNTKTCSNTNNIELLNIIIQANTSLNGQLRSSKLNWLYLSDSSKRLRKEVRITKVWLKILNKMKCRQKHFEILKSTVVLWYNGKFLQ